MAARSTVSELPARRDATPRACFFDEREIDLYVDLRTTETDTHARSSREGAARLPMPPTDRELAILRRVLGAMQVPGIEQLLDQLRMLQVSPLSDATCRIYLVHPDAPRSTFAREERSTLPTRCAVRTPGGRETGQVVVWVQHGHLCALQYVVPGPAGAMTLPDPDWIELPTRKVDGQVRAHAARQALAGVRAIGADVVRVSAPVVEPAAASGQRLPRLTQLALALCVALLAIAAYLSAYGQGADLAAARDAGATAGAEQGIQDGQAAGLFAGDAEGRLAGRAAGYGPAFVAARTRVEAQLQREATERERAAAAARTASLDNTTCAGYRDARGYWICT
jgi:hypothetical protein